MRYADRLYLADGSNMQIAAQTDNADASARLGMGASGILNDG